MDTKFIRTLILIFSGLIAVFTLLILLNYAGSLFGGRAEVPGQEEAAPEPGSAGAQAQEALAAARQGVVPRASMVPGYRQGLSTASIRSEGAISLVKDGNFAGVADKPKGMMETLEELSGGDRRKPAPVALKDSDLDKKIRLVGDPGKEPRLAGQAMPELGRRPGQEGVTLLKAPVDFKVFKSSETWWTFASTRKCRSTAEATVGFRPQPSLFSSPDFSRDSVVVLVSLSELPNGIFRIVKVEKSGKEAVVSYRVDPMAMAAGPADQHDFYSGAVVPAGLKVRLTQVP